ncbi:MAG: hypothetical protein HGA22_05340 [Clostridiales bacterium]|nr:hypothetical protein [Clostridiales bacterium]
MEKIYVVLTATGTMFSRFLALCTRATYNHVSICLSDEIREFYSFGRKIVWFPLLGGFVIERPDAGVYKAFRDTACLVYELAVNEEQYELIKSEIDGFIKNRDQYKYNLLGLLGILINKPNVPYKRKNRYFCTQFVAERLMKSGIHDFKKDPSLVTSWDFHSIPGAVTVYEGLLSDLSDYKNGMHMINCKVPST